MMNSKPARWRVVQKGQTPCEARASAPNRQELPVSSLAGLSDPLAHGSFCHPPQIATPTYGNEHVSELPSVLNKDSEAEMRHNPTPHLTALLTIRLMRHPAVTLAARGRIR